jgi:hypothetical protein
MHVNCEYNGEFAACGEFFFAARERLLFSHFFLVVVEVVVLNRSQTVATGPRIGPVATVCDRCDWENQTVGAKPNTPCRLQTSTVCKRSIY